MVDPGDLSGLAPRLLRIQHAAYLVEAELIGDHRIPALRDSVDDIVAAGLRWIVVDDETGILGALAFTTREGVVDIDRLVVDPMAHRRGIGRALVEKAMSLGREATVTTGRDNTPARTLYERLGFTWTGDAEVVPGLWVSAYTWAASGEPPGSG
jgi:ribosomal protein S18 acetylase RimI-like enzyme